MISKIIFYQEGIFQPHRVPIFDKGKSFVPATIPEMMSKTGLVFESVHEDAPVPASAKAIADYYRQASDAMLTAIKNQWNDQTLSEERNKYGERWTIGNTLNSLIYHQIHHRGQITVLGWQGLALPPDYVKILMQKTSPRQGLFLLSHPCHRGVFY